jgi:hypothetical protein
VLSNVGFPALFPDARRDATVDPYWATEDSMGNATLLALVFSLTFASSGGAADRSFAPDENGQIVFVTPSGNIGCTYIPKGGTAMYTPDDGGPELGCDRIQPLYVRLGPPASPSSSRWKATAPAAATPTFCSTATAGGPARSAAPPSEAALHARVRWPWLLRKQKEIHRQLTRARRRPAGLRTAFPLNAPRFALIRRPIPTIRREQGCHGWPFTV